MAHLAIDWLVLPFFYFSLSHTQTHRDFSHTHTHMLWRLPALWECLPVYLPSSTQRMTDDHLRHLSRPIVHAPYRTGPSSQRVDSPHIAHIVAASSPFRMGSGVCSMGEWLHHMQRSYRSPWKQAPHLPVPVRN